MGIGIYTAANLANKLSEGTFTAPLIIPIDGRAGARANRRLYVGNDEANINYSGISVLPSESGRSHIDGSLGYVVKLNNGDTQPTESGWQRLDPGSNAVFSGVVLSGSATFTPFWMRIEVPRNAAIENIRTVSLTASGIRFLP